MTVVTIIMEIISDKLKNSIVGIFILSISMLLGSPEENVKNFIHGLSQEQMLVMNTFFTNLTDSLCGYVLFGDKPICIEICELDPKDGKFSIIDEVGPVYNKGIELWRDLKVSPDNKEYFFLVSDMQEWGYRHLICINRKAFLQTVNENLPLFRYVLGPFLTAESLLDELIRSKDQFHSILKKDNALLGILFGYGTQNALLVSREEYVANAFGPERKEEFPFLSKKIRMHYTLPTKAQKKVPSLGFTSLADELDALRRARKVSRKLKPFETYPIPHFGCVPESKETQTLLDKYEQNRINIIKAIEGGSFLEEVLTKLFTTTSSTLDIPHVLEERPLSIPENKEELISRLGDMTYQEIKSDQFFNESFLESFLQGIKANITGESTLEISKRTGKIALEMYQTEQDLKRAENLEKSDTYFNKLEMNKNLITLIPNRLYFKILMQGDGIPVSRNIQDVSLHYTFFTLGENKPQNDLGTIKEESIINFIPGVALNLVGMRRGEEREIYIHPEYGYGENSYLPPNITIVAKIQLIDFVEGDKEVIFASPHHLERNNIKELLEKYAKLRGMEYYEYGALFWDVINKGDFIDFETFQKYFNQASQNNTDIKNIAQKEKFLKDLQWYLLSISLQKKGV